VVIVVVFIAILIVDGFLSHQLLSRMGGELSGVVKRDVVLMQSASAITRDQLQKGVVFERIRRIAEELAYQQITPARKEHLLFHLKLAKNNIDDLAKEGALSIVNAKLLVAAGQKASPSVQKTRELVKVAAVLKEIEKAHIHYDALVSDAFRMFSDGKYELSSEDLAQIHRDERKLATELQNLIDAVDRFTRISLANARQYERTAELILWFAIALSLLVGLGLAWWIIRVINAPLKALVEATHKIGAGELDIKLGYDSRDEIGEVSRAFNLMTSQLHESKLRLAEQRKELERNLELTELQKKDLEKVNRELDRFVQTVSHDIRSPLMGVVWYADFLKTHYGEHLDAKGRESLEGVCRSVERANALIKDLLDLTRLSRVRNPYTIVDPFILLDEVIGNLDYKIKQSKVDVHIQPHMPMVVCDGIKIREVFLNLMTNAIKFSSGEGKQPRVDVSYKDGVDVHEFIVKDNGIGIEAQHYQDIFAIFKRLDNSGKYEGTGAGLSIVKNIIDDHGGKVWVVSDIGQGSEFHFTIPKALEVHNMPVSA
ncbi:MAG: HAMP domain-containing protein, partial [Candidatus Omnitrophica bacterium]|nr:HAMP domain-containing protein [Candidatus Omnitrophota bacterium]